MKNLILIFSLSFIFLFGRAQDFEGDYSYMRDSTVSPYISAIDSLQTAYVNSIDSLFTKYARILDSIFATYYKGDSAKLTTNLGIGDFSSQNISGALHLNTGVGSLIHGVAFGDGNSGFYEPLDNRINIDLGGSLIWQMIGNTFKGKNDNTGGILSVTATSIQPTLIPRAGDTDNGIGSAGADQLSLIAGGVEQARFSTTGIDLNNDVTINLATGTQDYLFTDLISGSGLMVEGQNTGESASLFISSKDSDETDNITIQWIGKSNVAFDQRSRMIAGWNTSSTAFEIYTESATDPLRPLVLYTEGNTNQLYIDTDGDIGINKATPTEKLDVNGNIKIDSAGILKFYDSDGSNFVGFNSQPISADQTWVLPAVDGSDGQVLTTNGNDTLSFASVSTSLTGLVYRLGGMSFFGSDVAVGGIGLPANPTILNSFIKAPLNIPTEISGQDLYISAISITYSTDASGDDFDFDLNYPNVYGTSDTEIFGQDDIGNGSTGVQTTSLTLGGDIDMSSAKNMWIGIDVNNTSAITDVKIYEITFTYYYQ